MELVTGDLKQIKALTTLVFVQLFFLTLSQSKTNSMHLLLQAVFVFQMHIER